MFTAWLLFYSRSKEINNPNCVCTNACGLSFAAEGNTHVPEETDCKPLSLYFPNKEMCSDSKNLKVYVAF